jgi:hypothetical protein
MKATLKIATLAVALVGFCGWATVNLAQAQAFTKDVPNDSLYLEIFILNRALNFPEEAASLGVNDDMAPTGAAWVDYGGDLNETRDSLSMYMVDDLLEANRWLVVEFRGNIGNQDGMRARVTAVTGRVHQSWDVDGSPAGFVFGTAEVVDSLIISWPSGVVQTLKGVPTNRRIAVIEPGRLSSYKR